jgi:hypothetical protein
MQRFIDETIDNDGIEIGLHWMKADGSIHPRNNGHWLAVRLIGTSPSFMNDNGLPLEAIPQIHDHVSGIYSDARINLKNTRIVTASYGRWSDQEKDSHNPAWTFLLYWIEDLLEPPTDLFHEHQPIRLFR